MVSQKKSSNNYEKQLSVLRQTLQSLREEENEDTLIDITLSYLRAEFEYSFAWIGLYDRVTHRLRGRGGYTPVGDSPLLKQQFNLSPGDLLEQVVIQQRPLGVPDLQEEARAGEWRRAAQKFGVKGTVIFPVAHKNLCLGVVILGATLWGVSPHPEETTRLAMVLGELAAALYQLQEERQRQQIKRPDEPLLSLLNRLRSLPTLNARLEAVVQETHRFVAPTRTHIYWFEPERRYFWRRTSTRDNILMESQTNGFTAQEVNSFYQALTADQLVAIGEAHSSLKADITGRLMQLIKARSLLVAPILFQEELYGFLAVEGSEPRIWTEEEKQYVRGAGQLIALTAPLEGMEETVQHVRQDQALTAEVAQAIFSDADWQQTLKRASDRLSQRLQAERFLVLLYNRDQEVFDICYQTYPSSRRPLPSPLSPLNSVDCQMLERSLEAVGVENLEEDLKLMAWRELFLEAGLQSLMVCSTAVGRPLEGLVLVGYETARTWSRDDRNILRVVAQQVGIALHQWYLQRQADQQQRVNQTIQWGLTTMQQTLKLDSLERSAIQQIAQVLSAPMGALITWEPGRTTARVAAASIATPRFGLNPEANIAVHSDQLIQWALQSDGLLPLSIDDIANETRQWLNGSDIGQILAIALRTSPEHEPSGVVLVADRLDRFWLEQHLNALVSLVSQLAWSRRHLLLSDLLNQRREHLERLNWYKNRQIEEIYRILNSNVRRLNDLSDQKDPQSGMKYQQVLRQLGNLLTAIAPVVKQEQWQLHNETEAISLVTLLKHALERVDSLVKQRQIWSQIHNETNLNVGGDIAKVEFILYEVLTVACQRAPIGGRLDIWCRPLDAQWLEISITDNGIIEPRLLEEMNTGRPEDLLAPSALDQPPGLHLAICQALMRQVGGELNLYRLEDGRILSRLIMAIATNIIPRQR